MKKLLGILLVAVIILSGFILPDTSAEAKTLSSASVENLFFYALNNDGKCILLKVIQLNDLKARQHGQLAEITSGKDSGRDFNFSCTDNLPTTQYCEAKGFTIPELINYVKDITTVSGADQLAYSGSDTIRLMATDSYGAYNRSWTYNDLYGVNRYYFEGLFAENQGGWQMGWEIDPEMAQPSLSLDDYYSQYKDKDPYYVDKRAVLATGVSTTVILATESFSGRTTAKAIEASTEIGLADYISANGGQVSGCVSDMLSDDWSLKLCIPMSEADLMLGRRTAYNNFKWIYNLRLDMAHPPSIVSRGIVARPQADCSLSNDGNTLTISLSCATPGAALYYSFDGAPQLLYTDPVSVKVRDRDLSTDPVALYMKAVNEGWEDAGIISASYPRRAPDFKTIKSRLIGSDIKFSAADGVTDAEWTAWTNSLSNISMKTPSGTGYAEQRPDNHTVDDAAKTIGFKADLFTETGAYSFRFTAARYAIKTVSLSMKKSAPKVTAQEAYSTGNEIELTFTDPDYQNGMTIYISPPGGNPTIVSSACLDRSRSGKVTITSLYFNQSSCQITAPGIYTLELVNNRYSPASQNIEIKVGSSESSFWDLNGDAKCNLNDVIVIGNHWSETGIPGWIPQDVNKDGVINLGDVVAAGLRWGGTR